MDIDKERCTIKPWQQAVSSCTGGLITSILVTPLDVIKVRLQAQGKHYKLAYVSKRITPLDVVKTRLQVQQKPLNAGQCFLYCNGLWDHLCYCVENGITETYRPWYKKTSHFSGTWDALIKISKTEGVLSLWSGLSPTLVMAIPATVIYFTAYDQIKYKFGYREIPCITSYNKSTPKPYNSIIPIIAGSFARIGAVTVISPLELIRTKVQSTKMNYKEIIKIIKQDLRTNGILSLWRGWTPTILRDVPFSALYWFNYEYLKAHLFAKYTDVQSPFWIALCSGAIAGTVAAIITTPVDVIKTHRQIELGELEAKHINWWKSNSTLALMLRLYQRNGLKGLYAGAIPRIIKVAPACAIMISSYEYGKSFFQDYNSRFQHKAHHLHQQHHPTLYSNALEDGVN